MTEIKCEHELQYIYCDDCYCAICKMDSDLVIIDFKERIKELEKKLEKQLIVNSMLLDKNGELEQWQKEAVPFLRTSASNRRAGYRDLLLTLIKQAEGE